MNEPNEPKTLDALQDQLLALAAETRPVQPLPSAEGLLWKAEIRRRFAAQQHEEKATRPAFWGWIAGLLTGAATLLFVLSLHLAEGLSGAGTPPILWLSSLVVAPTGALAAIDWLRRRV